MSNGIAQFQARVDRFVAENNLEAVQELRDKLVVIQETRRVKFNKTRDVTAGKLYRAVGIQLGIVNNALRELKSKRPLDEEGFKSALGNMVKNGVQDAKDRVLYGVGGSMGFGQQARGRMDLRAATAELTQKWNQYVGREAAAGDAQIKSRPSLRNLEDFLKFTYGFQVGDDELMKIIGGGEAPQASPAPPPAENPADGKARQALGQLQKTSPKEYAALRAKFGKPASAAPTAQTESVVLEGPVEDTTFNPAELFPRLANILIRNGMIQVKRGGETLKRNGGAAKKGGAQTGAEAQTADARVTKDGHSIDIAKMQKLMIRDEITGGDMAELKEIVAKGPAGYADLERNSNAKATMVSLVTALLNSIKRSNDAGAIAAQHSITSDGNVMDINKFTEALEKLNVSGAALSGIREKLNAGNGGEKALIDVLSNPADPSAKVLFNVARAAISAIGQAEE